MFYLIVAYYEIYDRELRFCYVMAVWKAWGVVEIDGEC